MAVPVIVTFDHAQQRISRDRLGILAEGSYPAERGGRVSGFDIANSSNIWQDPVTFTAMLQPTVLDFDTWNTTNSGAYAKYATTDLTFSDPSGWGDGDTSGGVGWITKYACSDDMLFTPTQANINQPIWLAWFSFGAGDDFVVLECGWSDTGIEGDGVGLRFYQSGKVEVWKDGNYLAEGKISGSSTLQAVTEQWIGVMLIPFRRRELLIYSSRGAGFSHLFSDLDEDGTVQEIVPATKFWVKKPSGTALIQLAKLQFATSGTLYSEKLYFAEAPPTGATEAVVPYSDEPGYGSTSVTLTAEASDLSGAFTPDSSTDNARVKFALTGGPSASPFVYAGFFGYPEETDTTDDSEETDLEWNRLKITVPDSASGVKASVTRFDPAGSSIALLDTVTNRPVLVSSGGISLIDGRGGAPEVDYSHAAASDVLTMDVHGEWKALEHYRFQERIPLDGTDWKLTVEFFLEVAGWDVLATDIEDPSITIGAAGSPTAGEWSLVIQPGDTAAEWMERIFEAFAGDWFYGFVPTASGIVFRAKSPSSLPTSEDIELFTNVADARAQLLLEGYSADEAFKLAHTRTVQEFHVRRLMPEATDVRVSGYDLRRNAFLQAKYIDSAAEDPTTAPSSRPDNWIGEKLRFAYFEPMLTTQDLVDDAASSLGDRLTRVRTLCDFKSDFVFLSDGAPLWRGGQVLIDGQKWRIKSITVDIEKDAGDVTDPFKDWVWRPATYTGELLTAGSPPWGVSTGQTGSKSIGQAQLRRLARIGLQNLQRLGVGPRRG